MPYLDPDILSDEGAVAEAILAGMADRIPGWEPSEAHVETNLAEAVAMIEVALVVLLKEQARIAFLGMAERILGITRKPEGVATALSDWTFSDDAGYVIPDGTQVFMRAPDGELVGFATFGETAVPPGQTSALGVRLVALEAGVGGNGFFGPAEAVDPIVGVQAVALSIPSAGGADAEGIDDFADRATDRARRLRAVPITADDFAALALDHPLVARAMVVNLLDPANPPAAGQAPQSGGHLTVFPIDETGLALSGIAAAELEAMLGGEERPLNVAVHVRPPTFTSISVSMAVRLVPGAEEASMREAIVAAVAAYLSPATWALDEDEPGRWHAPESTADRTVTSFDVSHVAQLVPGVAGVAACTVNGAAAASLPGAAPLPRALAADITVSFTA